MGDRTLTFSNPVFLPLGVGLVLLVIMGLWSHARRRRRLAELLGGRRAVRRLSGSDLHRLRIERMILLGLAASGLAVALAEPQRPPAERPPPPPIRSVVVAIDVSASMQASDILPTRLAQAVRIAGDLITTLERDRVGLLLFAGAGYVLAPPTHDHKALAYLLRGVTPTIASVYDPGTLLSVGIREATALLSVEAEPDSERAIVMIGDGESGEPEAAVRAAARAAVAKGIAIHTIGVGTAQGAGMVLPDGNYRKGGQVVDRTGMAAISRMREPLLRRLADVGGGLYAHAADGKRLRDVHRGFETPVRRPDSEEAPQPSPWTRFDLTSWFALAALVCLLLESLLDVRLPGTLVAARRIA